VRTSKAANHRRYEEKREELIANQIAYQKAHPEQTRRTKSRADKKRKERLRNGPGVTMAQYRELKRAYGGLCAYCGAREADTFDHVIPLSRGGEHSINNVLPACRPCNERKHASTPDEWRARTRKGQ